MEANGRAASVKEPYNLSPRIQWLRDYYFQGNERKWNNEFNAFTTGKPYDEVFDETSFFIVPEVYSFFPTFRSSFPLAARTIRPPRGFYKKSIAERRALFIRTAMVDHVPQELLPGDLIAGGRFNLMASRCGTKREATARNRLMFGQNGLRADTIAFMDRGFGNGGATSGHIIPDYPRVLRGGFQQIKAELDARLDALSERERRGDAGAQLSAMRIAAGMPGALAEKYRALCLEKAGNEADEARKGELSRMADVLARVPEQPARDFWEALQSLWLTHMLVLSDENYPGAGVSFGRIDQYLLPYWQTSVAGGMEREFGKELLKCFFLHCNYAYDAMIKTGDQGITAGYGQLFNLSGMGPDGRDMTNELTYVFLEVIDEMSPLLEPKPNVRLHTGSPDALLGRVVDMIAHSQGAPFLLNFDERSMAGLLEEARRAGCEDLINEDTVYDYASVGCLENTMCGFDRSATVDCNPNLVKAVELALGAGGELIGYHDSLWDKPYPPESGAPKTGDPRSFTEFEQFYQAFLTQLSYVTDRMAALYDRSASLRARYAPTPYLSCLVGGCAESARDVTNGGARLNFITVEAVTYATTVDSLLAIEYLVFRRKLCDMDTLIEALKSNWAGYDILRAHAKNRAPKYGRDDDYADAFGARVMRDWTELVWRHRTTATNARFRPGMLSWNYWIGAGYLLPATPDGRRNGEFLSNAICPVNGADTAGPTANANSVGKVLGGKTPDGAFLNCLPNGASHTITLSPALMRDAEHRAKLTAFLRGYTQNGGTALQLNVLDSDMLKKAQQRPEDYRDLLVRVTGYNAYFTGLGRELQNEIIQRESHNRY